MTLYEITEDLKKFIAFCENADLAPEAVADTFEGLVGAFEDKAEAYAHVMGELKADIAKLDVEIGRLTDRKKLIKNNLEIVNKTLFDAMEATGKTKFKTNLYSFSIVGNGGLQPLKIDGEVPAEFMTTPAPVPNNDAIREYLKTNNCEWAHLEERGQRLSIK